MIDRFYCSSCQVGAEKAIKAEVLAAFPQLRFAFSRPGFITFKEQDGGPEPLLLPGGIFTRLWALVLGQARNADELYGLSTLIPPGAIVQCFDRDASLPGDASPSDGESPSGDACLPGDESPDFEPNARSKAALRAHGMAESPRLPQSGEAVYSLVWVDDFHLFLVRHVHDDSRSPYPGNMPPLALPAHSPSRAYLKIEEAFQRFKPTLERGMAVLEIGCAPGGATTAMLDRGLCVTGVDPQRMDTGVLARSGFCAIRKQARYLLEGDLSQVNPRYLVMDMSIPPVDALSELSHVLNVLRSVHGPKLALGGGFLTLKLNDWKFAAQIPSYLRRLEQMGFRDLRPIQLCSNRQEFFVYAPGFSL